MPSRNVELAREGLKAFNSGDTETLEALMADDVVAIIPREMPNDGVYEGRDGFWRMLSQWTEPWEEFRSEPLDFIEVGDQVVVPVRSTGRGRGSGIEVEAEQAHRFELRDGRMIRWQLYATLDDALADARAQRA